MVGGEFGCASKMWELTFLKDENVGYSRELCVLRECPGIDVLEFLGISEEEIFGVVIGL